MHFSRFYVVFGSFKHPAMVLNFEEFAEGFQGNGPGSAFLMPAEGFTRAVFTGPPQASIYDSTATMVVRIFPAIAEPSFSP